MKLIVAGFVLAVLSTVAASIGFALWDGHFIQRDPALRAIHYDTCLLYTSPSPRD